MAGRTRTVVRGASALIASQVVIAVAQFVYSAVTARVLLPEAFGAYAVALAGSGLLTLLVSTGLPSYVISNKDLSPNRVAAVVTVSWVSGLLSGLMLIIGAPLWAATWQAPESIPLTRALAVQALFAAPAAAQLALLRREGRALADGAVQAASVVVAMAAGIAVVLSVRDPLALTITPVATSILTLGLATFVRRIRFRLVRPAGLRELLNFASHVSSQNVVFFLLLTAPSWTISVGSGTSALGQFSRASLLAGLPATALTSALTRALQPHYRHLQKPTERRAAVTDAVLVTGGLALAPFLGLAGLGPLVIAVWLGPGWSQAGAYMFPLAVGFGLYAVFTVMANAGEAHRHFRTVRRSQLSMSIPTIALVACGLAWGSPWFAVVMMLVMAVAGLVVLGIGLHRDELLDGHRLVRYMKLDLALALSTAFVATVVGYLVRWQSGMELLGLVAGAFAGLGIWLAVIRKTAAWDIARRRRLVGGSRK